MKNFYLNEQSRCFQLFLISSVVDLIYYIHQTIEKALTIVFPQSYHLLTIILWDPPVLFVLRCRSYGIS